MAVTQKSHDIPLCSVLLLVASAVLKCDHKFECKVNTNCYILTSLLFLLLKQDSGVCVVSDMM